jgi:uncharacterized membrane protein YbhN (UPF0104 family)
MTTRPAGEAAPAPIAAATPTARRHAGLTRKQWIWIARLGVGVAMIVALWAYSGDMREILRLIDKASGFPLAMGLLVYAAAQMLQAVNLRWAMHRVGAPISLYAAVRAHSLGLASNLALPSAVGGDAVKAVALRADAGTIVASGTATLFARGVGVVGLIINAMIGAVIAWPTIGGTPTGRFVAIVLSAIGISLVLIWLLRRHAVAGARRVLPAGLTRKLEPLLAFIAGLSLRDIAFPMAIGWLYSFTGVITYALLGLGLRVELGFDGYLLLTAVYLVTLLPVSPMGMGLRDWGNGRVLILFGVATAQAYALAMMQLGTMVATGMLWGAFYLFSRPADRAPEPDAGEPRQ